MEMTKNEAGWGIILAILYAIQEAGSKGIPSGHLYTALCGKMDLDTYQSIIDLLQKAGRIEARGHLLKAL